MKKRTKALTACLTAFVIAVVSWRVDVFTNPDVTIPTDRVPTPNAFDYFKRAEALIRDKADLLALTTIGAMGQTNEKQR